jgi:hypothetical protein
VAVTVAPGAWEAWKPVVTDVREASETDLAALERRAHAAQGRDYTVTVETFFGPGEFSHGRTHDRLRFGDDSQPGIEVHVEPFRPGDKGDGVFGLTRRAAVLCGQQECVRVTGDEDTSGQPHLFDTIHDSALVQAAILVGAQEDPMAIFREGRRDGFAVGTARVTSPMGRLDCAVGAETLGDLKALEGQVRDLRSADEQESVMACLDARGLVVMTADLASPVIAYQSFRPGTASSLTEYPHPVTAYGS